MNGLARRCIFKLLLIGLPFTQVCNSYAEGEYRSCPEGYEVEAVQRVNLVRQSHGLNPLKIHPALMKSSGMRAYTVTVRDKLNHDGWKESILQVGYGNYAIGENLARGYSTPAEVVKGWLLSPDHRDNILDKNYNYIGIGCVTDTNGSLWWTQHFGGGS